ncbi:MAG: hypothetical protein FJ160_11515, partial [Gammaproteobacteria bacterium]|nr:hypothetical protein [Gammaproteobacteria bacterium]
MRGSTPRAGCGLLAFATALCAATLAAPVAAQRLVSVLQPQRAPELPITQVIVRFRDDVSTGRLNRPSGERLRNLSSRAGMAVDYRRPTADLSHVLRLAEPLERSAADRLVQRLRQDPAIANVEIDEYLFPLFVPNDTFFNDPRDIQWHLKAPSAARA